MSKALGSARKAGGRDPVEIRTVYWAPILRVSSGQGTAASSDTGSSQREPGAASSNQGVEIASSSSLPREQSALPIGGTSATRRLLLDRLAFSAPSVRSSVSDCLASSSHRQQQAAPTQGTPAQAVGCGGSGFESKIREVSQVVALVLADLAAAAGGDAPLVIVAHGLGAVVVATFLRDVQVMNRLLLYQDIYN
ncbi:hypothetical protein T492DRAFT_308839 [Pavlovales sp. CCMP2436]|nr:hypothetical protein T492DRAFT_308839 [Pavlovales sp. CCMP2436]